MKRKTICESAKVIVGTMPDKYQVGDPRLNKPVFIRKDVDGDTLGSMLLQDLDAVPIKGTRLSYFRPNNIGILLSCANKSLELARAIHKERLDPQQATLAVEKAAGNKVSFLNEKSRDVCDYVEAIQVSIVFSYTALETFANLSIPEDYTYEAPVKARGTVEVYDKKAIERWLGLKEKLLAILAAVYKTKRPERQKWWGHFTKLEQYRHSIVHQKSITSTEFYKAYFQRDIFDVCQSAEACIKFFYSQHANDNRTNPLWPWLVNSENHFPVVDDYDTAQLEVIGNLYEGIRPAKK